MDGEQLVVIIGKKTATNSLLSRTFSVAVYAFDQMEMVEKKRLWRLASKLSFGLGEI